MVIRKVFLKSFGIIWAAALLISACNTAATVPPAPTQAALPLAVLPSVTAATAPVATETSISTVAVTPTDTATATPTVQSIAQVIPNTNAYCRRGPGTDYNPITALTSGTAYNVIGRNSLNTWWLVEIYGGAVTCWTGAPGTTLVGPVEQAPIVMALPAMTSPSMFTYSYACNKQADTHSLQVTLNWEAVEGATGYRLYRNGVSLAELGATVTTYRDYNAPLNVSLTYELEADNNVGSSAPVYVTITACG